MKLHHRYLTVQAIRVLQQMDYKQKKGMKGDAIDEETKEIYPQMWEKLNCII